MLFVCPSFTRLAHPLVGFPCLAAPKVENVSLTIVYHHHHDQWPLQYEQLIALEICTWAVAMDLT